MSFKKPAPRRPRPSLRPMAAKRPGRSPPRGRHPPEARPRVRPSAIASLTYRASGGPRVHTDTGAHRAARDLAAASSDRANSSCGLMSTRTTVSHVLPVGSDTMRPADWGPASNTQTAICSSTAISSWMAARFLSNLGVAPVPTHGPRVGVRTFDLGPVPRTGPGPGEIASSMCGPPRAGAVAGHV